MALRCSLCSSTPVLCQTRMPLEVSPLLRRVHFRYQNFNNRISARCRAVEANVLVAGTMGTPQRPQARDCNEHASHEVCVPSVNWDTNLAGKVTSHLSTPPPPPPFVNPQSVLPVQCPAIKKPLRHISTTRPSRSSTAVLSSIQMSIKLVWLALPPFKNTVSLCRI